MKLIFSVICIFTSLNLFAFEARRLDIPADWNFIHCKQLENSGTSFWKKHYPESNFEIYAVDHQAGITYEISIDGKWMASCRFVTVQNLSK
ncbi:MAG: hypothetical protein Fur0010_23750 [Bdellovibrio sp.]